MRSPLENPRRVGIAAVVAALLAAWMTRSEPEAPRVHAEAARAHAPRRDDTVTAPPTTEIDEVRGVEQAVPSRQADEIRVVERRLIAGLRFEPESPCRDEDVLVHLDATPGAGDVKFFANGTPGGPVALRFHEAGEQSVQVVARDWHDGIELRDATLVVRDCAPDHTLTLREVYRRDDRVVLSAASSSLDLSRATLRWDLGDGEVVEGSSAGVSHDYGGRPQSTAQSQFVVRVTARDGAGREAHALTTLSFVNASYIARATGHPVLPVRYDRFARRDARAVSTSVSVRNVTDQPVHLNRVELRMFSCHPGSEPVARELAAGDVLDARDVAAGASLDATLSIPVGQLGDGVCRVGVTLAGVTRDGAEVRVPMALELGVPDDARPVTDPALLADIRAARALLGTSTVTPGDLARLRADGRLASAR